MGNVTQLEAAVQGQLTPEMHAVAREEGYEDGDVLRKVADGSVVIPRNHRGGVTRPVGVGEGLCTKVNANVGSSRDIADVAIEKRKLHAALDAGADAIMDLSTGGDLDRFRAAIREECPVPLGTVPLYQSVLERQRRGGRLEELTWDDIIATIRRHGEDGVDFITVHCGVTREAIARLLRQGRELNVVSRGGSLLFKWMTATGTENPYLEHYDELLDVAREHDMCLSLGDGMRPGCVADATDRAQVQELIVLGELVDRARAAGVQAMVEGPGHVPMDQIAANMVLQRRLCGNAPFYVLGPLVTDVAPGYDHITSAIGGAIAALSGAHFLCYVTPAEHLGLPVEREVREGVIASRIAAHAADLAKGNRKALEWDRNMARARRALDWDRQAAFAIDPARVRDARAALAPADRHVCTMCSELCAIRTSSEALELARCPRAADPTVSPPGRSDGSR